MYEFISMLCVLIAIILLGLLIVIDLKVRLLPNVLVASFAIAGFVFHTSSLFYYSDLADMALGAFIGGASLYVIRAIGNYFYKVDTLGLGDVKLMAAGGLWLGAELILFALTLGAIAGLAHGALLLGYNKMHARDSGMLSHFSLPAGPGFIVGIIIAAVAKFYPMPHLFLS